MRPSMEPSSRHRTRIASPSFFPCLKAQCVINKRLFSPKSTHHQEFLLASVPLSLAFLWSNISLASPGPSDDRKAETSFFKAETTPAEFLEKSFPLGRKTPIMLTVKKVGSTGERKKSIGFLYLPTPLFLC